MCPPSKLAEKSLIHLLFVLYLLVAVLARASPKPQPLDRPSNSLLVRQDGPVFPDEPPSCPICARDYWNINSCCQAAPVLANFTEVIFNPGAFIDVIKCACVDTFQSAYPQCVDCLQRTGQESFLYASSDEIPSILTGMRNVCAISSALLGNVQSVNGEVTPTTNAPPPPPTSASGATRDQPWRLRWAILLVYFALL